MVRLYEFGYQPCDCLWRVLRAVVADSRQAVYLAIRKRLAEQRQEVLGMEGQVCFAPDRQRWLLCQLRLGCDVRLLELVRPSGVLGGTRR